MWTPRNLRGVLDINFESGVLILRVVHIGLFVLFTFNMYSIPMVEY